MTGATNFMAALDKPTEARRAVFLAEACAGDERLRRRAEPLLRTHAAPDDVLDPTRDRPEAPGTTSPSVPDGETAGALVAGATSGSRAESGSIVVIGFSRPRRGQTLSAHVGYLVATVRALSGRASEASHSVQLTACRTRPTGPSTSYPT
jgi:hypothetical protein